jgi:hypothetical protein
LFRIGFDEYQTLPLSALSQMTGHSPDKWKTLLAEAVKVEQGVYNGGEFTEICHKSALEKLLAKTFKLESNLKLPLKMARGGNFFIFFYSRSAHTYSPDH